MLRANILSIYVSQGWRALASIIFVPIYIKLLGIESYAIIGLYGTIQAALSLCDFGFRASFARDVARYKGGELTRLHILEYLKTIEIVLISVSMLMVICSILLSSWVAIEWFKDAKINHSNIEYAIISMSIMASARFVEAIYSSGIDGLQKQLYSSLIQTVLVTIQNFGAVGMLIYKPELNLFFQWQIFFSIISLLVFRYSIHYFIPSMGATPKFSIQSVLENWKFSTGMFLVSLLAFFLTQMDRIILSGILSLSELGGYLICVSISSILYLVANPICQAFYPRLIELIAANKNNSLEEEFRFGSQLIVVLVGAIGVLMIFFSADILNIWMSTHELSKKNELVLSFMALGTLLNVLVWMPSRLQTAAGWTILSIYENLFGIALLMPGILFLTPKYGSLSAALMWVLLNSFYLIFGVNVMFNRLASRQRLNWFLWDTSLPLFLMGISAYLVRKIVPYNLDTLQLVFVLPAVLLVLALVGLISSPLKKKVNYFYKN